MPHGLLALLHRANQIATADFYAALDDSHIKARQVHVLAAIETDEGASRKAIVGIAA